jgi:surface polysaccharide O-acyltransferase-like enzyme
MEKYTEMQFKVFDWLRFPLIVGVVFIHCFGKPFDFKTIDFINLSGIDCYNLIRVSISMVLTHICVPVFYLISGYLFFIGLEKWDNFLFLKKIKKRCISLLIPFLIWNSIYILMSLIGIFRENGWLGVQNFFIDNGYWHLYWDCREWNLDRVNWLGLSNRASSPYLYPLWFLRDLMVVCLASPILYAIFNKIKILGLALLLVCYVSGLFINKPGFSATAFLFFGAGAYFRMNNIDVTRFAYKYRSFVYVLAAFLWIICTVLNGHNTTEGDFVYPFYIIVGSIALLNLSTFIVRNDILNIPTLLIKSSFFVYLLHPIKVINIVLAMSEKVFGGTNPILMTIGYLLVPVVVVGICVLIYYLMDKFTPRLCKVLTGAR